MKKGRMKAIASMLVLAITFGYFGYLQTAIASEVENQNSKTNQANVEFDAYLMKNGEKTYSDTKTIGSENFLYAALTVKNAGYLKDAKFEVENANFEFDTSFSSKEVSKVENNKISYKLVTADDAEEISKYGFESGYQEVVGVASDGRTSYISGTDLYTYDDSYNVVDLTEQKITNAINNLSATKETKVYFVEGKTNYTTESGIYYLTQYLGNEYYEVGTINIMADPTIPDDCDVLAIMGLSSDFTSQEADNICKYIEKGGDLIITNDIDYSNVNRDFPNFQRILNEYDISMPNKVVQENSDKNKVSGYNNLVFQANIASDHEITRLLYNYDASGTKQSGASVKPLFIASGIIEMDSTKMLEYNIKATSILMTSTQATVSDLATKTTEENSGNYYTIGAAIQKTVESGDESRLVVFASTSSFSDNALDNQTPMVAYNANIIMNSFAFASNRGELYSIRKSSSYTKYTPTDREDTIVRVIIYVIPVAIIVLGMCVWLTRRKLK